LEQKGERKELKGAFCVITKGGFSGCIGDEKIKRWSHLPVFKGGGWDNTYRGSWIGEKRYFWKKQMSLNRQVRKLKEGGIRKKWSEAVTETAYKGAICRTGGHLS